MITEQYVTFETSRLLKEAGFNCRVKRYFRIPGFSSEPKEMSVLTAMNINREPRSYSRPTQALASRWLREVHHIFIEDYILINGKFSYRIFIGGRNQLECEQHNIYQSYEDCVEYALQEAIKLIKKQ